MDIISGIYKITNIVTGDFYIGSSKNIKRRWKDHRKITTRNKYNSYPLYKDMILYGLGNFKFEILEECENSLLKKLEYEYFLKLKPKYNISKPFSYKRENIKRISGIYKILNNITGEFYIGSSKDIKDRWRRHRLRRNLNNPTTLLYKAIKLYGINNFSFYILEECNECVLLLKEQQYIDDLKPQYNMGIAKRHMTSLEYQRDYCIKNKEKIVEYKTKNREYILERNRKYYSRKCFYNNEEMTLSKLINFFVKMNIKNPTVEAKKYLIST